MVVDELVPSTKANVPATAPLQKRTSVINKVLRVLIGAIRRVSVCAPV